MNGQRFHQQKWIEMKTEQCGGKITLPPRNESLNLRPRYDTLVS